MLSDFWILLRPFTLIAPILGILSGISLALGFQDNSFTVFLSEHPLEVIFIILASACLNNASNILNQITDLEIDRLNKPLRPLVKGVFSIRFAAVFSIIFYLLSLFFASLIGPNNELGPLWIVATGALLTLAYSMPPIRTKKEGTLANLTIALARGCLLPMCGWAVVDSPNHLTPWIFGGIYGLFIFGAASTKDFSDAEGDARFGCTTWVIRFGPDLAARIIAPFLFLPWILLAVLWNTTNLLNPNENLNFAIANGICFTLIIYGIWISRTMISDINNLSIENNHRSWKHIYLLYQISLIGIPLGYHF